MLALLFFIVFLVVLIYYGLKGNNRQLNNHWSQYLVGLRFSTKEFYEKLKTVLQSHEVSNLKIEEVSLSEGGITSSKRLYLRLIWDDLQYDICFAPFGNSDSFVSWWLWRVPTGLELIFGSIPIAGPILNQIFFPQTYYRVDTSNMFMTFAQSKVLKILDEIMKEQNITALPEHERYPIKQSIKIGK